MLTEGSSLVDSAVAASTARGGVGGRRVLIVAARGGQGSRSLHRRFLAAETGIALALDEKKGSGRNSAANIVLRL
jgi:hypothetical protein